MQYTKTLAWAKEQTNPIYVCIYIYADDWQINPFQDGQMMRLEQNGEII